MHKVAIELFGQCRVTLPDGTCPPFATAKTQALLAYLALGPRRSHPRRVLASLLWPEAPETTALANLSNTLNRLRQALGDQQRAQPLILATAQTVQCNSAAELQLDVADFDSLLATCHAHPHRELSRCAVCAERLEAALALAQGPLLDGLQLEGCEEFDQWLSAEREGREMARQQAMEALAHWYDRCGDSERAMGYVLRQLQHEPWREEAYVHAMQLLAAKNQWSAAMQHYNRCCRALKREFSTTPSEETRALAAAMKRRDRAAARPTFARPAGPAPVLIGRTAEMQQLLAMLSTPERRIITICGYGGSGKTSLARATAHQAAPMFEDGAVLVELASVEDRDGLVQAIVAALGGINAQTRDPFEHLVALLMPRDMLLVLDNVEQLLDHRVVLAELVRRVPGVTLLLTSRARLRLRSEWVLPLDGLALPPADCADPGQYAAVELFLERAAPGTDMAAAAQLCRLVHGVPLAIELAAALSFTRSCAEIAAELTANLDILRTTAPDTPLRHQSLQATFDYSWRLLAEREQRLLGMLTLFADDFDRHAVETVCAELLPTAAESVPLDQLVDAALVQLVEGRYRLHPLVRQYASGRLPADIPLTQVWAGHSAYFLALLAASNPAREVAAAQVALNTLDANIGNIRQAWLWAARQQHAEALLQAAPALRNFILLRGWLSEGEYCFASAAAWCEADSRVRGLLLAYQSDVCSVRGDLLRGSQLGNQSLAMLETTGTAADMALACASYGKAASWAGDYEAGAALLARAVACAEEANDPQQAANAWSLLGLIHEEQAQAHQAESCFMRALHCLQTAMDARLFAVVLNYLGLLKQRSLHDSGAAARHFAESRAVLTALGDQGALAFVLANQGMLALELGELEAAEADLRRSLAMHTARDNRTGLALALSGLARVALARGDYAEAERQSCAGLRLAYQNQEWPAVLDHLNDLGLIYGRTERRAQASELFTCVAHHPCADHAARRLALEQLRQLRAWPTASGPGTPPLALEALVETLLAVVSAAPAAPRRSFSPHEGRKRESWEWRSSSQMWGV
ncbi:MAG: AAA family ATPase [Chloroflexaceae bacterium]|jgi:predicted ATPase/DNA-binding SARP family transcriptional activator|nr:AAA family ATPase [Chloroflexaceae bacterium]